MNIALFLETNAEYMNHLMDAVTPYVYEGLLSIYREAVNIADERNANKKLLLIFQKLLQSINDWSHEKLCRETDRIKQLSLSGDYLDMLLRCVVKSKIVILSCSDTMSQKFGDKFLDSISTPHFIHLCYIECGKYAHNNPYLFYHEPDKPMEHKRNLIIIQTKIDEGIRRAIRKLLPVSMILKEYLEKPIALFGRDTEMDVRLVKSSKYRNYEENDHGRGYGDDHDRSHGHVERGSCPNKMSASRKSVRRVPTETQPHDNRSNQKALSVNIPSDSVKSKSKSKKYSANNNSISVDIDDIFRSDLSNTGRNDIKAMMDMDNLISIGSVNNKKCSSSKRVNKSNRYGENTDKLDHFNNMPYYSNANSMAASHVASDTTKSKDIDRMISIDIGDYMLSTTCQKQTTDKTMNNIYPQTSEVVQIENAKFIEEYGYKN